MKSFARRRNAKPQPGIDPENTEGLLDVADLDIAPLGASAPATEDATTRADDRPAAGTIDPGVAEAAEFAERLGDLDRFIGGGTAPAGPVSWNGGVAARNLPAAPIPAVAPISHPRPAPVAREAEVDETPPAADPDAEAQDFVERLGDLDRFIGGNSIGGDRAGDAPAAPPAGSAPAADPETEAQDFLDRLGDLDRFIGGNGTGPTPPPT